MIECKICGAIVNNPEHHSHIRSKKHQEAIIPIKELKEFDSVDKIIRKMDEQTTTFKDIYDPGNLNILISHVERCGVSWFCRLISIVYEYMFGKLKKWNIRTSRLMAAHPDYPISVGWNTVRYTPIEDIIKKKFDKIILLQRKLESLKESIFVYRFTDKDYKTEKDKPEYDEWFKKLEKYYYQTYARIKSPKVLRVYLEDLNNYTVSTLNEILDFLGFPKEGRPFIIPVNPPERTWQAFSAVLNKGQEIHERLLGIYYKYNEAELEFIAQKNKSMVTSSNIIGHENALLPIEKKIQNKWQISMNPTVSVPDALEVLKKKKETMMLLDLDSIKPLKIVIIGSVGLGLKCHFSENINNEFRELGMDVVLLSTFKLIRDFGINFNKYHLRAEPREYLSLKKILKFYNLVPNIIFIDSTRFLIENDTEYFTFYNHRGWHLDFSVKNMNITFLKNESYKKMREKCNMSGKMVDLSPSVSMEIYQTGEKMVSELVGIGYRRTFDGWRNIVKYYEGYESIVNLIEAETLVFKKSGYKYFDTTIKDLQYREILKMIKCLWFPIPYGQHITRRMIEAMACKVLCVFRLDDEQHEKCLRDLGFINRIHYIGLESVDDIPNIKNILEKVDIDEIIENAYRVVKEKHTHKIRAKQILEIYESKTRDKFDVIVPMYNIKNDISSYIENWFRELPINRLIVGIGKDDFEIPYKYRNFIIKIYQKKNKTLGKCLTELMKEVKTKWFVYLHSDVKIVEHGFDIMKAYIKPDIGGIEGSPIVVKHELGKLKHVFHGRKFIERAYSGFQMFRKKCLEELIEKVEDDYMYRNEDMITQNAVYSSGFKYVKTWAMYLHYNEGKYIKTKKDAKEIFLGLLKYTKPNNLTKNLINVTMRSYNDHFKKIKPDEIIEFVKRNNVEWLVYIGLYLRRFKS